MVSKAPGRPVIKVAVATTDWSGSVHDDRGWPVMGGAGWIRLGQWAKFSGNHVVVGELIDNGVTMGARTFDAQSHLNTPVLIMQRFMDKSIPRKIERSILNGQKVINDIDDWFWGIHPENMAAKHVDPDLNPDRNVNYYREALEASSIVTTSTPFLAHLLSEWGIKPIIVENKVSFHVFPTRRHLSPTPIIGWVGSTGHRSGDLKILREPFAVMKDKVSFHHTGDHTKHVSFAEEVGLDDARVTRLPMLAPHEYPHGFKFDIGVVPLTDNDFNRAKSWIKGIEYAAAGVPFVASPLPEYIRLRDEYGIGRIAHSPEEWVEHFTELLDPSVRLEEAKRQRIIVEARLGARQMAREWDSIVWL